MARNVIRILKNSKCKVNQFEKVSSDPFFAQRKSESLIIIFNYSVAVSKLFNNKDHLSRVCYFFYVMLNNYNILFMVYNFYILYMLYYPQLWSSMSSLSRFLWRIFFPQNFRIVNFSFQPVWLRPHTSVHLVRKSEYEGEIVERTTPIVTRLVHEPVHAQFS